MVADEEGRKMRWRPGEEAAIAKLAFGAVI